MSLSVAHCDQKPQIIKSVNSVKWKLLMGNDVMIHDDVKYVELTECEHCSFCVNHNALHVTCMCICTRSQIYIVLWRYILPHSHKLLLCHHWDVLCKDESFNASSKSSL